MVGWTQLTPDADVLAMLGGGQPDRDTERLERRLGLPVGEDQSPGGGVVVLLAALLGAGVGVVVHQQELAKSSDVGGLPGEVLPLVGPYRLLSERGRIERI